MYSDVANIIRGNKYDMKILKNGESCKSFLRGFTNYLIIPFLSHSLFLIHRYIGKWIIRTINIYYTYILLSVIQSSLSMHFEVIICQNPLYVLLEMLHKTWWKLIVMCLYGLEHQRSCIILCISLHSNVSMKYPLMGKINTTFRMPDV